MNILLIPHVSQYVKVVNQINTFDNKEKQKKGFILLLGQCNFISSGNRA